MSWVLDGFTKFVNSPGGALAAGGLLAVFVWKFFERVEAVLTDQTKLEIAVWLLGVRIGQTTESLPTTFATVLDRVFGKKHFSLRSFVRSAIFTWVIVVTVFLITLPRGEINWLDLPPILIANLVPDYFALFVGRRCLYVAGNPRYSWAGILLMLTPFLSTYVTVIVSGDTAEFLQHRVFISSARFNEGFMGDIVPTLGAFLASLGSALFIYIWLLLYAASGFIITAARRFDLGFDWFNRKFDIEKHPLQSIGLVAGAIVAVVYWAVAGISRLL